MYVHTKSTYPSSINGKRLRNQGLMMMIIIPLIRTYAYIAGFLWHTLLVFLIMIYNEAISTNI